MWVARQASRRSFCWWVRSIGESGGKPPHSKMGWARTRGESEIDRVASGCWFKGNARVAEIAAHSLKAVPRRLGEAL
jgi:hypothetical protein